MAITIDGVPVSGSIGNNTFSRNRAGAYKRRRTKPVNPNSSLQQNIRAAFAAAINAWTNELTPLQRSGWDTYAAAVPWLNKAGQPMLMTGQNAFVRFYTHQAYWQEAAPVVLTAPGDFDISAVTVDPGNNSLTYDTSANTLLASVVCPLFANTWNVDGSFLQIAVSQPVNGSRNFRPNRFAKLAVVPSAETPVATFVTAATASPWVYTAGQRVWLKLNAIQGNNNLTVTALVGPVTLSVVA